MKYSLADYIVSIKPNDSSLKSFGTISIGGEGSATDSISVELDESLFETTSFATGAWVHDKNLARTGKIKISLSQLSDQIERLIQLARVYYGGDYEGMTVAVTDSSGQEIASCIDCYFTKIPAQEFTSKASNQSWELTSGKITFS